jgi:hypothetical protein
LDQAQDHSLNNTHGLYSISTQSCPSDSLSE